MSLSKRIKTDCAELDESNRELFWNQATQNALEEIDACQNHIDLLNEKASEDILKVEQRFNKLRKPFFERRNLITQKIESFWITAFVNHPQITALLDEDEEDCLHRMTKLEVEEFEDIKFGYRIKFFFDPNRYFENEVLIKEFHVGAPVPCSKSSIILWKKGQNLIEYIKEKYERNQKQGKKRKPECKTFFTWFEEDCDPTTDEIAEVIKDDLWPNPLQYYLSPDIEVEVAPDEEGGEVAVLVNGAAVGVNEEEDDTSDEDGDDSVVIMDEIGNDEDWDFKTEDFENVMDKEPPNAMSGPPATSSDNKALKKEDDE